jgi:hypothetical protein
MIFITLMIVPAYYLHYFVGWSWPMAIVASFVTTASGGAFLVAAWCAIDKKRTLERAAEVEERVDKR